MKRWIVCGGLAVVIALSGCGESSETASSAGGVTLPGELKTFLDAHPELNLKITRIEQVKDWAEGKRWRGRSAAGEDIIVFEKNGAIESVRRKDLSFIWDRAGRK
ncbi:MAG: hypothetical protein Kow0032_05260 [Methyloligellaceae bacterium]